LKISTKDRDWVVVGATAEELLKQGYEQVGADFPVFLHPRTKEEYALARTERKSGHGYQGFDCRFTPDVTLEEDLMRRDLTINAMAQDSSGQIIDPFNGQQDLNDRVLRHVSSAFIEDPLRVLRVARFSARFAYLGFRIADETQQLMTQMVADGELEHLVAERVWTETERALGEPSPSTYFQVLRDCGALKVWFPELDALFGVPQPEQHHPEIDTGVHALMALDISANLQRSNPVRWATLTHDLGKALTPEEQWPKHHGHENKGKKPAKQLGTRLKAPKEFIRLSELANQWHTHVHRALEMRPETIMKLFDGMDAWRRPEQLEALFQVSEADSRGRTGFEQKDYPQADFLRNAFDVARQVTAKDVIAEGITGRAIGEALVKARTQAIANWKSAAISE
ncbi:MAG: multifunctional CCA addition/repair protein, partial [Oceanobacter sp.]